VEEVEEEEEEVETEKIQRRSSAMTSLPGSRSTPAACRRRRWRG
jgi:hypothetical protein